MDTQYNIQEWARRTKHGRRVLNYQYRMIGRELKGMKLIKSVTMREERDVTERVYLWQNKEAPQRQIVSVAVYEWNSWRGAQKQLHIKLQDCMRLSIPMGTGKLAVLGDVNFVGRDPQSDVPASVFFTRGNVCVLVNSVAETNLDVSRFAEILDATLSEPPPKTQMKKELVRVRELKVSSAKAEKGVTLIKDLRKAAPRGEWLKVIATEGELTREVDRLIYAFPKGRGGIVKLYLMHTA